MTGVNSEELERITNNKSLLANWIGGKGICPPEECRGPYRFKDMKVILNKPKYPESKDMRTWLGLINKETWETDNFDRRQISEWLKRFSFDYLK